MIPACPPVRTCTGTESTHPAPPWPLVRAELEWQELSVQRYSVVGIRSASVAATTCLLRQRRFPSSDTCGASLSACPASGGPGDVLRAPPGPGAAPCRAARGSGPPARLAPRTPARLILRRRPARVRTRRRKLAHELLLVAGELLLRPDDAPRPHDAQPAHGLARREAVVLRRVEREERAGAAQARRLAGPLRGRRTRLQSPPTAGRRRGAVVQAEIHHGDA